MHSNLVHNTTIINDNDAVSDNNNEDINAMVIIKTVMKFIKS